MGLVVIKPGCGWLSEKGYNQLGTGFLISLKMQGHEGCSERTSCPHLVPEAWEAGQVGSTSGLQEAMWIPLLSDCSLSHSGVSLDLALDPSESNGQFWCSAMRS